MFFTTRAFWADFAERVVSTGAAGALTVVTLSSFGVFDLHSWQDVAAAAGVSALISALKAFSLQRTTTPGVPGSTSTPAAAPVALSDPLPALVAAPGAATPAEPGVTYALQGE